MGIWQIQSVLNRGELDPKIVGRTDLQQYYQGVELGDNTKCIPQGGQTKRGGQQYIDEPSFTPLRIENFSFNVEQNYVLVFSALRLQIYKDDVLQTNINASGNDWVAHPWASNQVPEFDYIQSADTVIITHPNLQPYKITRTSDTDWAVSTVLATADIPLYDYNDVDSPTPTDEEQRIVLANVTKGDRFKLVFNGLLTDEVVYDSSDAGVSFAADMAKELNALPNIRTGTVACTATSATQFDFVFDGESADDWEFLKMSVIYVNNTSFSFTTTQTVAGVTRQERVWSADRGWPKTCTFHEGRLWFGGSAQLPQTVWGSYVNDFFKFVPSKGLDDEPISATLDTDQINAIEAIYSNRSLQVFTAGAEFYCPESPITPSNVAFQRQTNLGTKRLRPVTIDGITLFVQRFGKSIYQFLFLDELQANQSTSVSILAPHLIKNPIEMAVQRGTTDNDANYVFILNDDGTVTVFNTLTTEGVAGFTRWETLGDIKSIAVVDNSLYLLTEREINSSTVYYLEKENNSFNTDSSTLTTGSDLTTITGLDHLEAETVNIKADGAYRGTDTVASGQIIIDPAADEIEVGLEYKPTITTMPLNVNLQSGPNAALKKKILRCAIHLYESNGIIVNDQRIPDRIMGVNQFDPPEPQTGYKRVFLSGWGLEAQITITQDTPFPFTILSIANEVKV